MSSVFKITPTCQSYDWGKIGNASQVAQLATGISDFTLDESKPYAELWMGTHVTSPSHVSSSNTLLSEHLAENSALIGDSVASHFAKKAGELPFLFKVLSIAKALSIQTHPDKATAQKLHAEQPDVYKDDNHKPEMALALTPFRALCGFLPLPDIAHHLNSTPELAALIPKEIATAFFNASTSANSSGPEEKAALKNLFAAIMTAPEDTVKKQLNTLVQRYKSAGATSESEGVQGLVLRLDEQFPGDIGIFCAFLLNYITLNADEAIFLGAGEPHAYISGDAMECMAASDNVIRAGLTPKLRDVPNLVSGLTYVPGHGTKHYVKPTNFSESSALYDPPIPEFSVLKTETRKSAQIKAVDGPSIALVQNGEGSVAWNGGGEKVKRGDVVFVGAGTSVEWNASHDDLVVYTAFVEAPKGA